MRARAAKTEPELSVDVDGRAVPLRVRRNRRARRLILRIDADGDSAVVTLPPGAGIAEAVGLAKREAAWIGERLRALPPRIPFADGAIIPILGADHRIRQESGLQRPVQWTDGEILMIGKPTRLAREIRAWLRAEARATITPRAHAMAAQLGRKVTRVTVRDTRSRWGSCAPGGRLSFCWRLVMAPAYVLDYVVAHEVAHLAEPRHDADFWRTVATLDNNVAAARDWLRRDGPGLHRYG